MKKFWTTSLVAVAINLNTSQAITNTDEKVDAPAVASKTTTFFTDDMMAGLNGRIGTVLRAHDYEAALHLVKSALDPQRTDTGTLQPTPQQEDTINTWLTTVLKLHAQAEAMAKIVDNIFPQAEQTEAAFPTISTISDVLTTMATNLNGYVFLTDIDGTIMERGTDGHFLIDVNTAPTIKTLEERGAKVLAFTHRSMDSNAEERLQNLGVTFTSILNTHNEDNHNGPGYKNGIFYAGGGEFTKEKAIIVLMKKYGDALGNPTHLVMVDDNIDNVHGVKKGANTLGISNFSGFLLSSTAHQALHLTLGAASVVDSAPTNRLKSDAEMALQVAYNLTDSQFEQCTRDAKQTKMDLAAYLNMILLS